MLWNASVTEFWLQGISALRGSNVTYENGWEKAEGIFLYRALPWAAQSISCSRPGHLYRSPAGLIQSCSEFCFGWSSIGVVVAVAVPRNGAH